MLPDCGACQLWMKCMALRPQLQAQDRKGVLCSFAPDPQIGLCLVVITQAFNAVSGIRVAKGPHATSGARSEACWTIAVLERGALEWQHALHARGAACIDCNRGTMEKSRGS